MLPSIRQNRVSWEVFKIISIPAVNVCSVLRALHCIKACMMKGRHEFIWVLMNRSTKLEVAIKFDDPIFRGGRRLLTLEGEAHRF